MTAFLQHVAVTLRLYFRNRMALLYGYLFPAIFLLAFWALYRDERVPLARHMGELLTIAVLGGACFGLPTTMVGERERGVWRRYRATPVGAGSLVSGTVAARYLLLLTAGLLQLALAMAIGMPAPRHPLQLLLAFSVVSFAFLGLGLVIAMLADNVPAVQALGQCLFLPMLIVGGVAVPLAVLPDWARHVSAFLPGRYAVQAIQASVSGPGIGATSFSLAALVLIGLAGTLAGARMFRWDAHQRFAALGGKGWTAVALAAWVAAGALAESRGEIGSGANRPVALLPAQAQPAPQRVPAAAWLESPVPSAAESAASRGAPTPTIEAGTSSAASTARRGGEPPTPTPAPAAAWPPVSPAGPKSWRAATVADIDRDLTFGHLPPDSGIISPIARSTDLPDPDVAAALERLRLALPAWAPGKAADPLQRTRNYLYIAAVPDVLQRPLERFAPGVIFARLQQETPREDLIKILYWIAMHPEEGDDGAIGELPALGIRGVPEDMDMVRERVALYGVKLLGRLLGRIPPA